MDLSIESLEDAPLISLCLQQQRHAWNEFFRRFIPVLKKAIKKKLIQSGGLSLANDPDIIWDIHKDIVENLYTRGNLKKCLNPVGIRPWLREVATNQTIDWLRRHYAKKRNPERQAESNTISLQTPIQSAPNLTLEQTLESKTPSDDQNLPCLPEILSNLDKIDNTKGFWAVRLSIISHLPLTEEDINNLANFNGHDVASIRTHLQRIEEYLEKKEHQKITADGRAVLLWHEIRRLENELTSKQNSLSCESQEIERLKTQILSKNQQREQLLRAGKKLCRPANDDIAILVGLPPEKADQISNILLRARESLQKKLAMREFPD